MKKLKLIIKNNEIKSITIEISDEGAKKLLDSTITKFGEFEIDKVIEVKQ